MRLTSSTGTPTITLGSLAGDDTVTWTQTFDYKHVGTVKTMTPHGTVKQVIQDVRRAGAIRIAVATRQRGNGTR